MQNRATMFAFESAPFKMQNPLKEVLITCARITRSGLMSASLSLPEHLSDAFSDDESDKAGQCQLAAPSPWLAN
jgi:hypothetical protein